MVWWRCIPSLGGFGKSFFLEEEEGEWGENYFPFWRQYVCIIKLFRAIFHSYIKNSPFIPTTIVTVKMKGWVSFHITA